jgi:hypothetical protein
VNDNVECTLCNVCRVSKLVILSSFLYVKASQCFIYNVLLIFCFYSFLSCPVFLPNVPVFRGKIENVPFF